MHQKMILPVIVSFVFVFGSLYLPSSCTNQDVMDIENLERKLQASADYAETEEDARWQEQLAKYNSHGMPDSEVIREHRAYVRKIQMMKEMTRKCIRVFEYILTGPSDGGNNNN